jgi:hypothetical protein
MRHALPVLPALLLVACSGEPALQPEAPPERLFPDQRAVLAELVAMADDDGDGVLSRAEYERYDNGRDAFLDVDLDGDQRIDLAELERALRRTDPGFYNNPSFDAPSSGGSGAADR